MTDGIIDLTQYLSERKGDGSVSRGAFSLWGADGERSRFALPLWRSIYLAQGERGGLVYRDPRVDVQPRSFVVLDLAKDPARLDFTMDGVPMSEDGEPPVLYDFGTRGLAVFIGMRDGLVWHLVVDGCAGRAEHLTGRTREDVLFLAGECAGLLFLRDFADEVK